MFLFIYKYIPSIYVKASTSRFHKYGRPYVMKWRPNIRARAPYGALQKFLGKPLKNKQFVNTVTLCNFVAGTNVTAFVMIWPCVI